MSSAEPIKQPRVFYMGQEISHDELPEAEAVSLDDHFAPVMLSPRALDRASQIVPMEHWLPLGLYTWLYKRANFAFGRLPITAASREIQLGKLKYEFEFSEQGPVLKTVTLA